MEWDAITVHEQGIHDGLRLIVDVGKAMSAHDPGEKGGESQIGIGKGQIAAQPLLQLQKIGIDLSFRMCNGRGRDEVLRRLF